MCFLARFRGRGGRCFLVGPGPLVFGWLGVLTLFLDDVFQPVDNEPVSEADGRRRLLVTWLSPQAPKFADDVSRRHADAADDADRRRAPTGVDDGRRCDRPGLSPTLAAGVGRRHRQAPVHREPVTEPGARRRPPVTWTAVQTNSAGRCRAFARSNLQRWDAFGSGSEVAPPCSRTLCRPQADDARQADRRHFQKRTSRMCV